MADRRRALHRASAHLLLQQDGDETGHDAGGERERRQAAHDSVVCVHAVSISQKVMRINTRRVLVLHCHWGEPKKSIDSFIYSFIVILWITQSDMLLERYIGISYLKTKTSFT